MDILSDVISDMEKEDVRFYKLFANRMYYSQDRKDLQLFDYIYQSGDKYDEGKITRQLSYGDDKKFFLQAEAPLAESRE